MGVYTTESWFSIDTYIYTYTLDITLFRNNIDSLEWYFVILFSFCSEWHIYVTRILKKFETVLSDQMT